MRNVKIVTDYLDNAVEKAPSQKAFIDEYGETTYVDFQREAKKVASVIIDKGINKKPIAVFLGKSTKALIAAFGVVYSGNFYTFLDTEMPMARIKKIVEILEPSYIITDDEHANKIDKIGIPIITLESAASNNIYYDRIEASRSKAINTDIVYVLFTSGSTGIPKGVVISHINIITYMNWSKDAFGFSENTVFGNQTPFYFSMSVLDIYQTFACAGKLVIIPRKMFSFPIELVDFINKKGINTIYWVPSALCQVANMGVLDKVKMPNLHTILFAGEVMPTKQLNIWRKNIPNALYADLFGPTEVTDICTYYILDRNLSDNESVPIGKACDNMDVFIINEHGSISNKNEIGELYVRGASVAYGYYNNPKKTADVFVQNPINSVYPEIVYKTGDLVYINDYDEIIYVSRKDFQIKHMGYRIELGEIETAVSSLDGITRNCCIYDFDKSLIVLFFTGEIEGSELRKKLKHLLPKYMLPNIMRKLEEMPLNLNGKIDRNLLKQSLKEK